MSTWKTNGWKTTKRTPVANRDLLEKIDNMRSQIEVEIKHIPGHSGIPGNEQANKLAIDALSN